MSHPTPAISRRLALGAAVSVAAASLVVAGCSSEPTERTDPTVTVSGATMDRPANPGTGAVRLVVHNEGSRPDVLVRVSSSFAEASVHRSGTDAAGRATMTPVERLDIPSKSEVRFEPGGLHVMLTGLPSDLAVGDRFPLDLDFEHAGRIRVQVTVTDPQAVPRD